MFDIKHYNIKETDLLYKNHICLRLPGFHADSHNTKSSIDVL